MADQPWTSAGCAGKAPINCIAGDIRLFTNYFP
jgi:hypothetical protein